MKTLWIAVRARASPGADPSVAEVQAPDGQDRSELTPTVTGERVVTSHGGFNATWQRHVAAYALSAPYLGPGRVLDVGCGIGHSYRLLAPRETVGVDIDAEVLVGQERETVAADMRRLPFAHGSFDGAIAVHSIEHVPDPDRALAEIARVLRSGATAVLVTPNRLTFARPDEIIDPYHYVEYDAAQLAALCEGFFERVELAGIFGSERYRALVAREHAKLDRSAETGPAAAASPACRARRASGSTTAA